ncbi:MAG: queuosine salvage family protein [Archaeoglobaceae archaeon]
MINEKRLQELANILKELKYSPISFDNPELFPEVDEYIYPNYVFFMVAIDHKTGFEVNWKYRGSDLLFYLARRKQKEVNDFFTAKNLVGIKVSDVESIFSFQGKPVANAEERAFLLRDCAEKLLRYHDGDFMNLLRTAEFSAEKIIEELKKFRAYEDPLKKKSYLLLKILKRQGFVRGKLEFPVDSVLVEVALSAEIVYPSEKMLRKIKRGEVLSEEESYELRKEVLMALNALSKASGIEADVLDDILWVYGREIHRKGKTALDERVDKVALEKLLEFIRRNPTKVVFPRSWFF